MESGYVKFFLAKDDRLFGFLESDGGDIFFHYSDGKQVTIANGEVSLENPSIPLRYPKMGDELMFERGRNRKGPKAAPWCFKRSYEYAQETNMRSLTLDEAKQLLADKPCEVLEYTDLANLNGLEIITNTTTISWTVTDDRLTVARGTFVEVTKKFTKPKIKRTFWVDVHSPETTKFHRTSFEGAEALVLKDLGGPRQVSKGVQAGVLWNGGWESYVVDPDSVRDMTDEELDKTAKSCQPTIESWLRCNFASNLGHELQVVKVLAHLGGGD